MISRIFLILLMVFSTSTMHANTFEEISLKKFTKENLSENKLRFSNQNGLVVHLQVDSVSKALSNNPAELKKDVEEMLSIRKSMYKIFGFKNVLFENYQKQEIQSTPTLIINGSYQRINNKLTYFKEINFYLKNNFLQVKIIAETKKIKEEDVQEILEQINVAELKI